MIPPFVHCMLVSLLLVIASCTAFPEDAAFSAKARKDTVAAGPDGRREDNASEEMPSYDLVPGMLTRTAIPEGACGMVLWAFRHRRPEPVFRYIADGQGKIRLDGEDISVELTAAGGDSAFGIYEKMQFRSARGLKIDTVARFGPAFQGGVYLEEGLVRLEDISGWSSIVPVAGVAGCR